MALRSAFRRILVPAAIVMASPFTFSGVLAQGGGAPPGACGPPGEHIWCGGAWEGATFNAAWSLLAYWAD